MNAIGDYASFIQSKKRQLQPMGFDPQELNPNLMDWQRRIVRWAVRRGRAALFEAVGLGKTIQQLSWLEAIYNHNPGPLLLLAPLGVREQTRQEAEKFSVSCPVMIVESPGDIRHGINITNYEKLHLFEDVDWCAVALDESSILKNYTGKTKQTLVDQFKHTPYRLACTATPAPNDRMELGNHAEWLGVMPSNEMLSRWFINDTMKAGGYRLRKHAKRAFWEWMASWSVCAARPSDVGGSDEGFVLPPIEKHIEMISVDIEPPAGQLFNTDAVSATNIHAFRRQSSKARATRAAELVATDDDYWLIWCDTDYEADDLIAAIPGAVEVRGSHSAKVKTERLQGFSRGEIKVLISKPSVAGFGMNWQHCRNVIFSGIGFSYESYHQAVGRTYRFRQQRQVRVWILSGESESTTLGVLDRKEREYHEMMDEMAGAMKSETLENLSEELVRETYQPQQEMEIPAWLRTV